MADTQPKKLSTRHEVFLETYLQCWNATDAYQVAFPRAGRNTARNNGAKLLASTSIQAAKQARLNELHMSTDEALKLLADQARGDMGDMLDITSMGYVVDIKKAHDAKKTKLIRKLRQKTVTIMGKGDEPDTEIHTTEVELYDSQAALDKILRVGGKLTNDITVLVKYADNPDPPESP